MRPKPLLVIVTFLFCNARAQDYLSYGASNFAGLGQVIANPSAAADNRLKYDVIVTGVDFNFNNSWFRVKGEALKYTGTLFRPSTLKFPDTWQNYTPNVPGNFFKNFDFLQSGSNKALVLESRILLPSFMISLNRENAVAFTWSIRHIANVSGISPGLGELFEKEFDLNITQNNRVQNDRLRAIQMTWAEYGFTYARVVTDKNKHFFKAGITPKILQGLESRYLMVNDLDFLFSTKDSLSYFKMKLEAGHSANITDDPVNNSIGSFYHYVTKPSFGLDLGFMYEWRPQHAKFRYRPDRKHYQWRRDLNKYKLKAGAAITDIGSIAYSKQGTYYDLDVAVSKDNFRKFTTLTSIDMFDSLLRSDFSNSRISSEFRVMLPTAFNAQVDWAVHPMVYLNLSAHIGNLFRSHAYRVYNYTSVSLAPRFEQYWYDVSLPFIFNTLSADRFKYVTTGLNVRLGPLSMGTNDLIQLFSHDVAALNFYAILKVAIPYKLINDQDGDGVKDRHDKCPDDPGDPALHGCPDSDRDRVYDMNDACPHQAGLVKFKGCPDSDKDNIPDADDDCPDVRGTKLFRGCPDSDGDSIPDKDDACPHQKGIKAFKGCADEDKDGIIDDEDLCPEVKGVLKYKGCNDRDNDGVHDGTDACADTAGPAENKGCPWPDRDKDGIIDRLDSCRDLSGIKELNGCPEQAKLSLIEKRILQKAYSKLEFTTGSDIIKPASLPSLNALAKLLLDHQGDWKIKLSGHTDDQGSEQENLLLSEKRARAVKNYLVSRGVPQGSILIEWFGQLRPLADNKTQAGRQKNRRVEMVLFVKEK
jgi:outer membrane protein OmpA-like peptidoglycan-associated protein